MSASVNIVLVIDDDQWIVDSTAMVLESEGFKVVTADNGEDGITRAASVHPSVILLDVMMPGLDGWETLERLKTDPATRETPVVIFSAREFAQSRAMSRQKGASAFVGKPFEPERLIQVVRKYAGRAAPAPASERG
jgi:CheY-like chemotaxis protein